MLTALNGDYKRGYSNPYLGLIVEGLRQLGFNIIRIWVEG